MKEVRYDWVEVERVSVLDERYYSVLSDVELEALRQVIRERGEEFSLENPIKVNSANGGELLILRDGLNRLRIFKELGYKRIYAIIRVFEEEEEAVEDAKWGSIEDNWHRGQRDPKQLIELVKKWTKGLDEGEAAKLLVRRGFSRSYAYDLIRVVRDEELSEMVVDSEISLRRAIELIRERKSKIVSDVGQIGEKPGEGVISEKEALSELHKLPQTRRRKISPKKARKKEISKKKRGGRPRKEKIPGLTARLRDELERAFKALRIEDESTRTMLMSEAAEVLGSYPVEIQSKAVRKWREGGGSMSFQQALQEVKKAEKEEEPEKEYTEGRPQKPEGVEGEEVGVEKPAEISPQQVLLKVEVKSSEERIKECAEYFEKYLVACGVPKDIAAIIADHEQVIQLYKEVGATPLNFESLLYAAGWKKIVLDILGLKEGKKSLTKQLISKRLPKLVEELRKNLDLVRKRVSGSELQKSEILEDFRKLLDAESKALPNGSLLVYSDVLIRVVKPLNIFLTDDFAKHLRLQEALANLTDNIGGYEKIRGAEEKLQIAEVSPDVVGFGYHAYVAVPLCPACRKPLTCSVCGAPVNCKCGWPSIKYGKARRVK